MSTVALIQKALKNNPAIIVRERTINYFPEICPDGYGQIVNFWVAPKQGIYSNGGLQHFMESLLPWYKPVFREDFSREREVMVSGKLVYVEELLKKRIAFNATHKETMEDIKYFLDEGLVQGVRPVKKRGHTCFARLIMVRPVSDEAILDDILNKRLTHDDFTDMNELKKYKAQVD